jgi:hypothetical protein
VSGVQQNFWSAERKLPAQEEASEEIFSVEQMATLLSQGIEIMDLDNLCLPGPSSLQD